jgi:hypothetical protein
MMLVLQVNTCIPLWVNGFKTFQPNKSALLPDPKVASRGRLPVLLLSAPPGRATVADQKLRGPDLLHVGLCVGTHYLCQRKREPGRLLHMGEPRLHLLRQLLAHSRRELKNFFQRCWPVLNLCRRRTAMQCQHLEYLFFACLGPVGVPTYSRPYAATL